MVSAVDREVVVSFSADDCAIQLVTPPDATDACVPGMRLNDEPCTAYLVFRPDAVQTSVATLQLLALNGDVDRSLRVVGAGRQSVIVMRHAPRGGTRFVGGAAPPATVVSVSPKGRTINGFAPSLSEDGTRLAFVSGFRSPPDSEAHAQVLLHVTDADGDRTWRSGPTTNVSRTARRRHVDVAVQPSLSGDGRRLAFVEILSDEEVGARVHVRDLERGISRPLSSQVELAPAYDVAPSLSRDGSTVTFTSDQIGYLPPGAATEGLPQVFVQAVPSDFAAESPAEGRLPVEGGRELRLVGLCGGERGRCPRRVRL